MIEEIELLEETDRWVFVQGPAWGDARFYGEWLLSASEAEAFWKEAYSDKEFQKRIDRVCICYIPDFGMAATAMFMQLREYRTTFVLELESDEGELFTMMAAIGFFAQNGPFYRMTLPDALTLGKIKTAVIEFAETEDEEFVLHPERLISTMPFSEAGTTTIFATTPVASDRPETSMKIASQ